MERYTIDIAPGTYAGAHVQSDPDRKGEYWCCLHFNGMEAASAAQKSFAPSGQLAMPAIDDETRESIERGRAFMAKLLADIPLGTPLDRVKFVVDDEKGQAEAMYSRIAPGSMPIPLKYAEPPKNMADGMSDLSDMDADTAKIVRELTAKPNTALPVPEAPGTFLGPTPTVMSAEEALALLNQPRP